MEAIKNLSFTLVSDLDYEGMVVDLKFKGHPIAVANYDKGADNIELEILPLPPGQEKLELPLDELMNVLQQAKEILLKCAEQDKTREKF